MAPGTRVVVQLRGDCKQFSNKEVVESVVRKFSNFVNFPLTLNDVKVNTVGALWTRDKSRYVLFVDASFSPYCVYICAVSLTKSITTFSSSSPTA